MYFRVDLENDVGESESGRMCVRIGNYMIFVREKTLTRVYCIINYVKTNSVPFFLHFNLDESLFGERRFMDSIDFICFMDHQKFRIFHRVLSFVFSLYE